MKKSRKKGRAKFVVILRDDFRADFVFNDQIQFLVEGGGCRCISSIEVVGFNGRPFDPAKVAVLFVPAGSPAARSLEKTGGFDGIQAELEH